MSRFHELLAERDWLLADGATGTNYFHMGLQSGDAPELWNIDHPDRVRSLHRSFIAAGSDIVLTNSFGCNRYRLKLHAAEDRVAELNGAAARNARAEADAVDRPVLVAGSMGPTGEIYAPVGPLDEADGAAAFAEQAQALADGGADLLWIETISSCEELRAAVSGAAVAGLPIVVTMSFDTNGRTMMGLTPEDFAGIASGLEPVPAAIGANCGTGAAELVVAVLAIAAAAPGAVVVAKGNCGIPRYVDGHVHYTGTPEVMADYARLALDAGARIIGGCCGTSPEHLAAMHAALSAHERGPRPSVETIVERLGEVSALSRGEAPPSRAGGERRRRRPARSPAR
ncbi:betaine--homocysteine S-methyltransferase [Kaustia mangrovi]|uniref:Betaine--homocysteine S-methyltransferase n=1 Tax=Kaustia mangrovi TaxID=2593653 RepID=A0A7S8C6Q7_9HYPH|nr:betaine--homocysteine S-methyltransferase [Kaustia mangrovi]QPC44433.1 betaine--homocysteine S-methyltransferase [Kaustia mangrovi]